MKKVLVITHGLKGIAVTETVRGATNLIADFLEKSISRNINDDYGRSDVIGNISIDKERFHTLFNEQAQFNNNNEDGKSIWTWTDPTTGDFFRLEGNNVL